MILLIIFLVLLAVSIYNGCKRGMVKALISFISMIVFGLVIVLGLNLFNSYVNHSFFKVVLFLLALILLIGAHIFIKTVLFPAKIVAKLPVINSVNKLCGIIFGALEAVVILWTVYAVIVLLGIDAMWGQWIVEQTASNSVMTWLYNNNYILNLVVNR